MRISKYSSVRLDILLPPQLLYSFEGVGIMMPGHE